MGIRYYAYAFDSGQTEKALADPFTVIGADPFADVLGLEEGFTNGSTDFRPSVPERDLLFLDKSWLCLQRLTAPSASRDRARPAYRMFEGHVTYLDQGMTWRPWLRALTPDEVAPIARDVEMLSDHDIEASVGEYFSSQLLESEIAYVTEYLHRAKNFVQAVASEGRGFAYLIG
ncbi:hypothetical protein IWX64_000003 [Arthrobacter sp. CAN_A212]|uniref:DUF1877 family protein n=1 Tax=Arthrobacter sp. CAN_A212 TaxID=2787719 RepID=UPI0018CB0210